MLEIDVHGETVAEAIALVARTYNHHVRHGQRGRICIIHGYGSSGTGGRIAGKLRTFLDRCGVEYLAGELADGNPGCTILLPGNPIPAASIPAAALRKNPAKPKSPAKKTKPRKGGLQA